MEDETIVMVKLSAVSEKPALSSSSLLTSSKHWYIPVHHSIVSSPKTDTSLDKLPQEPTDFHHHCEFSILQCDGISIQE
jgi:hypothetical protein